MPELPDIENYTRYLKRTALHKTIRAVEVGRARIVRGASARKLAGTLKGNRSNAPGATASICWSLSTRRAGSPCISA